MPVDKIELKPCPFCGGNNLSIENDDYTGEFLVLCAKCGPACLDKYKADSIALWNQRASLAETGETGVQQAKVSN